MVQCSSARLMRLLSEVALEASEVLPVSSNLPSYAHVRSLILRFLGEPGRRNGAVWKSQTPRVMIVLGDWGEGKTAVYKGFIESREDIVSVFVTTEQLAEHMDLLRSGKWGSAGARLLAIILGKLVGRHISSVEELDAVVEEVVARLVAEDKRLVVFIDEFEYLATLLEEQRQVSRVSELLEALVQLRNVTDVESVVPSYRRLAPLLHFVVALTRRAYNILSTRAELSEVFGRFTRRAERVDLKRFTRVETIALLDSLLKYSTGYGIQDSPFLSDVCMLNPLLQAAAGIPGAIERGVNTLLEGLEQICGDKLAKLDESIALDVLSQTHVVVEGEHRNVLIRDAAERFIQACRSSGVDERVCTRVLVCGFAQWGVEPQKLYTLYRLGLVRARVYAVRLGVREFLESVREAVARVEAGRGGGSEAWIDEYRVLLDPYVMLCTLSASRICIVVPEYIERDIQERLGVGEVKAGEYAAKLRAILEVLREKGVIEDVGEAFAASYRLLREAIFTPELTLLSFVKRGEREKIWREAFATHPKHVAIGFAPIIAYELFNLIPEPRVSALEVIEEHSETVVVEVKLESSKRFQLDLYNGGKRLRSTPLVRIWLVLSRDVFKSMDILENLLDSRSVGQKPHAAILLSIGEAVGSGLEERALELQKKHRVAIVRAPLRHVDAVKMSALALVLVRRLTPTRLGEGIDALARAVGGERRSLINELYEPEVYDVLHQLYREYQHVTRALLAALREVGVVLPRVTVPSEGVKATLDALRWLVYLPEDTFGENEAYEYVESRIRRHLVYGKRYQSVIGRDIESAEELVRLVKPLEQLGVLEARHDVGEIRLTYRTSPFITRLVAIAQDVPLEELISSFIWSSPEEVTLLVGSAIVLGLVELNDGRVVRTDVRSKRVSMYSSLENVQKRLSELIHKYGVIVSGKERGYRISSTTTLIKQIKEYLELAEHKDWWSAARHLAAAERLLYHVLGVKPSKEGCNGRTHVDLLEAAYRKVNNIRHVLEEALVKLKNIRHEVEALSGIVRVTLVPSLESRVAEALRILEEAESTNIDENSIRGYVESIWRDKPGTAFPFYFRIGHVYCYNMKLYMIALSVAKALGTEPEVIADETRLREKLEGWVETLTATLEKAQGIIANVWAELRNLRDALESVTLDEVVKSIAPNLAEKSILETIEPVTCGTIYLDTEHIGELLRCVEKWRKRINIENVKALIEDVKKLAVKLKNLRLEHERLLKVLSEVRGESTEARAFPEKPLVGKEGCMKTHVDNLRDLRDVLLKLVENEERLLNDLRRELSDLVAQMCKDVSSMISSIASRLRSAILIAKVAEVYRVSELRDVAVYIAELQEKLERINAEYRRVCGASLADVVDAVVRARGLVIEARRILKSAEAIPENPEKLLVVIGARYGLNESEMRVLKLIAERGEILIEEVARELGVSIDDAWRLLKHLAQMGVVAIVARPAKSRG